MTVHGERTLDSIITAYSDHQRRTRGLRESTIDGYAWNLRCFLRATLGDDPVHVSQLRPTDVIEYVSTQATRLRPRTVKAVVCALRSFFRFLRAVGLHDGRIEECVPTVPVRRLADLPRHLDEEQHTRFLKSLDVSTPRLRRDRAIILCLSALGLRAGEVADLCIEDIDWRAGTLRIRARKTGRGALLPLPHRAGRAIASYLRDDRPATHDRHVFVRHWMGVGEAVSSHLVSHVVATALRHAGVEGPHYGAHVLRHTLATRMVRHGATLKEIADVLGHRHLVTTTIYAKTDIDALSGVALPWPQVRS